MILPRLPPRMTSCCGQACLPTVLFAELQARPPPTLLRKLPSLPSLSSVRAAVSNPLPQLISVDSSLVTCAPSPPSGAWGASQTSSTLLGLCTLLETVLHSRSAILWGIERAPARMLQRRQLHLQQKPSPQRSQSQAQVGADPARSD